MAKYGKWIGLGLGLASGGGWIGGLLGMALGSMFDNSSPNASRTSSTTATRRGDFAVSLLVLVAAVMKADGHVLRSELDYVKNYFRTRFGEDAANESVIMLRDILKKDIPIREVTQQLNQRLDYSYRLEMIHFLYGIAAADSSIAESEKELIRRIAAYLNITPADMESIQAMFINVQDSWYKILEIEASATDEDVKKAYRRMAMKYHPDKVAHLGDDFKKVAHEKFKKVQNAYDNIKKERGMK